jgi:hypothetical protein
MGGGAAVRGHVDTDAPQTKADDVEIPREVPPDGYNLSLDGPGALDGSGNFRRGPQRPSAQESLPSSGRSR